MYQNLGLVTVADGVYYRKNMGERKGKGEGKKEVRKEKGKLDGAIPLPTEPYHGEKF